MPARYDMPHTVMSNTILALISEKAESYARYPDKKVCRQHAPHCLPCLRLPPIFCPSKQEVQQTTGSFLWLGKCKLTFGSPSMSPDPCEEIEREKMLVGTPML